MGWKKCTLCGSWNTDLEEQTGYDIDGGGESTIHTQHCLTCGAQRFVTDTLDFLNIEQGIQRHFGKWRSHVII